MELAMDILYAILSRFRRGNTLRSVKSIDVLSREMKSSKTTTALLAQLQSAGIVGTHTISSVGRNNGRHVEKQYFGEVLRFLDNKQASAAITKVVTSVVR
jgi:hypothetical protein